MLRLLSCIAIFYLSCRVCSAREMLRAAVSCPPASGWETNVLSGTSLAWNFKSPVVYWGYTPLLPCWETALLTEEPEMSSLGYWKLNKQGYFYHTYLPTFQKGGFVPGDLVGRCVFRDLSDDAKEYVEFQANGHALFTYVRGNEPPVLPLFYWHVDYDGYLLVSQNEDLSNPFQIYRLIKRDGQKLVVELNGNEFDWEYLRLKKK
jgi:hypothetical protein